MNSLRQSILFCWLAVFFASNVGLSVFTHFCSMDSNRVQTSFFLEGEDPCETIRHEAKEIDTCCADKTKKNEAVHKKCCSTDAQYISLDTDESVNNYTLQASSLENVQLSKAWWNFENKVIIEDYPSDYFRNPPPKHQGRHFFPIHQVYIL